MKRSLIALILCLSMLVMLFTPVMGTFASEVTGVVTPSEPSSSEEPEIGETDDTEAGEETVPGDETETAALQAGIKTSAASTFAGETAQAQVKAVGGLEPYTITWKAFANGAAVAEATAELTSEELVRIECTAGDFGTVVFQAVVTDAEGNSINLETGMEVAVKETEDKAVWEEIIAALELNGNWAEDIVTVAQSQIGYAESSRNFVVEGGQKHGYTRYGDFYSVPYADWCTLFVRFCIEQAGIDAADYPQDSSCFYWVEKLTEAGCFADNTHTPSAGDLFFINLDDVADPDHMGIVLEAGETIKVIEGNSESNDVRVVEYQADDARIVGYGLTAALMELANAPAEEPEQPEETPDQPDDILGETAQEETATAPSGVITQNLSGLWDGQSKEATLTFAHADAQAYQWLAAAITDGESDWQKVEGATGENLTLAITAETLSTAYQCACKLADGTVVYSDAATVLEPALATWFALESDGTSASLLRALSAKSLDSLVIESGALVHVRTGEPVALIDAETGAITDLTFDIVVGHLDPVTNTIIPAVSSETAE